jgi:uncharacterized protein DUF5916
MMRKALILSLLFVAGSGPTLFAADAPPPPLPITAITRAAGPITIDGSLDDPGWKNAAKFETWYETNPGDNIEPKVKQIGYVTYDEHFFYVAMDMWDPKPSQIRSLYADHDGINGNIDDYAGPILDTRNDSKTGYLFLVNAHNVQYDAVTDDSSGNEDSSPDFFWDSATKLTDHGWTMEMRVPFSSLRYSGSNPSQWGLILYRNMPRERRYQIFSNKLPRGSNCFVCNYGKITGLQGLPSGGHIVAAPYATARETGQSGSGSGLHYGAGTNAGADVKWTPNADTAVDGTINPDFSQVESDSAAISTNQRFAIFFPEKRPFFLEGTELFSTPIQAVYTRTITAPRWGIRSTGKVGGSDAYTVLVSDDRGGGSLILPGPLGNDFADQDFGSLVFIGRERHDVGKNSFLSFLATAREEEGGSHNRVLGPDFQWKNDHHTVTGQLLFSDSRTPNRPDLAAEWNGQSLHGHAGYIWYNYSSKTKDFYSEYKDYSNDFRADNGFLPQVGYRSNYTEAGYTIRPTDKFFSRVRFFAMGQYDQSQDSQLLYRLVSGGFGADGKYRSFWRFRFAHEKVRSGDDVFNRNQLLYSVQLGFSRFLQYISFNGWVGQEVDFANSRLARGADVAVTATLRPTDHLDISISEDRRWLHEHVEELPPGTLFTAQVERIRAVYTFNSRMFIRTIIQNQRTNRNQNLYSFGVNQHGGSLATQVLGAYKLNWQTLIYLGVGDLRDVIGQDGNFEPSNRTLFAKISYAFQR